MDERALLELEDQVRAGRGRSCTGAWRAAGLAGQRVLQLGRGDREAVQGQAPGRASLAVLGRVVELAGDGEAVGRVELLRLRVHAAGRGEVGHAEQLAEALEAVPQDGQAPLVFGVQRPAEIVQQRLFGLVLLEVGQVLPFLGLGLFDEGQHVWREEATLRVEGVAVAFLVPARACQVVLDRGFKGLFGVLARHQANLSVT